MKSHWPRDIRATQKTNRTGYKEGQERIDGKKYIVRTGETKQETPCF